MKRNLLTLVIGGTLLVLFVLLLFVFQVRKSEVAVVTTFSKPTRDAGPGAHLKWPWPIERIYTFDQRIQTFFEDKAKEELTADGNNLVATLYLGWRISDPKTFFPKFRGGSVREAERMLEGILSNAKGAVVGKHPLGDFVNADPKQLKFDLIESEMKALVDAQLRTNNCGVLVEFLGIKKLGLPESVTQTVFERMTSERNVLANRYKYEGEAEALKISSAAERQASDMLSEAEAKAIRIRGLGEEQATRLLPVFEQSPELANFEFRLKALEQSLKDRTTLIFDQRTPPFDLFQSIVTNRTSK